MLLAKIYCATTLLMLVGVGCGPKASQAPPAPPAPTVEVAVAVTRQIIDYREFTGRTAAMESVEILARVSGYLLRSPRMSATPDPPNASATKKAVDSDWQITAKEGELVEKGAPLFLIDPQPYQLALDQSLGSLKASQARLTQANQDLSRSRELRGREAASEAE